MTTGKAIGLGCGITALIGILVVVACVLFVRHMSTDLEGVSVTVSDVQDVRAGDTFELKVTVTNERKSKALGLSDIDIADEYLEGFVVVSVSPKEKSTMHVPIDDSQSYTFDVKIPAGESRTFVFKLRAVKEGVFRGDVDVCEGMQFITALTQTVVIERE